MIAYPSAHLPITGILQENGELGTSTLGPQNFDNVGMGETLEVVDLSLECSCLKDSKSTYIRLTTYDAPVESSHHDHHDLSHPPVSWSYAHRHHQ